MVFAVPSRILSFFLSKWQKCRCDVLVKTQEGDFYLEGLWFYRWFKIRPKDRNPSSTNSKHSHVTSGNRECLRFKYDLPGGKNFSWLLSRISCSLPTWQEWQPGIPEILRLASKYQHTWPLTRNSLDFGDWCDGRSFENILCKGTYSKSLDDLLKILKLVGKHPK